MTRTFKQPKFQTALAIWMVLHHVVFPISCKQASVSWENESGKAQSLYGHQNRHLRQFHVVYKEIKGRKELALTRTGYSSYAKRIIMTQPSSHSMEAERKHDDKRCLNI